MIVVAGSANLDFVVRVPHIPGPGATVLGQSFQTFAGGKGANQAVKVASDQWHLRPACAVDTIDTMTQASAQALADLAHFCGITSPS
jgi:sugar/nucleoside kinase (ribokinase family)